LVAFLRRKLHAFVPVFVIKDCINLLIGKVLRAEIGVGAADANLNCANGEKGVTKTMSKSVIPPPWPAPPTIRKWC